MPLLFLGGIALIYLVIMIVHEIHVEGPKRVAWYKKKGML